MSEPKVDPQTGNLILTDEQAVEVLKRLAGNCSSGASHDRGFGGGPCYACSALEHAFQAIEDRARLVGACAIAAVSGSVQTQYDASLRHMEGRL